MSKAVDFDALPLYSYGSENPVLQGDRLGLFRDCAEEHIGCFRRCWNSWPPWPIERGNKGHYLYCQSKCLAEYMECEDENEAERVMTYCTEHPAVCATAAVGTIVIIVQPELTPMLFPTLHCRKDAR